MLLSLLNLQHVCFANLEVTEELIPFPSPVVGTASGRTQRWSSPSSQRIGLIWLKSMVHWQEWHCR